MQATKWWILAIIASSVAAHGVAVIADAAVDVPVSMQKKTVPIIDETSSLCQAYLQSGVMDDADMQHLHELIQECILRWDEFSESERNALAAIFDELAQLLEVVDATKSTRDQGNVPVLPLVINQNTERLRDLALRTLIVDNLLVTSSVVLPVINNSGIKVLNGQVGDVQNFATGTNGNAFTIVSGGNLHTFNMPSANSPAVTQGTISNTQVIAYNAAVITLEDATSNNVPLTLVARDSVGSFSAQNVTAQGVFELPATTATAGQLRIDNKPVLQTYGTKNIFIGESAGNFIVTATQNVAVGPNALSLLANGFDNVAIGARSQANVTLGIGNISLGSNTLSAISVSQFNIAIGSFVMNNTQTGSDNIGMGYSAFSLNNIGSNNIGFGRYAQQYNAGGSNNIALGQTSLRFNTSGNRNVAIGSSALLTLTIGSFNTAIGNSAGSSLVYGSNNVLLGEDAGLAYAGGESYNICIGYSGQMEDDHVCRIANIYDSQVTGRFVAIDSNNRLGYDVRGDLLITATSKNVVNTLVLRDSVGSFSGQNISAQGMLELPTTTATTGQLRINNSAVLHTYGATNTFVGSNAGNFTMTGGNNIGMGDSALAANVTGGNNVAIGFHVLMSVTAQSDNIGMGRQALENNTSYLNVGIGRYALQGNTTGYQNVALGPDVLRANTTGYQLIGIGSASLRYNETGVGDVAAGADSLLTLTTGSYNTAIGHQAGRNLKGGDFNTLLGYRGGYNYSAEESNNVCIGVAGIAGDDSVCRIGNIRGKTTGINNAITVLIDSNNQLGTVSSSARYKTNIQDLDTQRADAILAVRPVTFNYLNKDGQPFDNISMGLIAEEVAAVNPEWVVYDEEGLPMTIRYHELIIPVIKQLQQVVQSNSDIKNQCDSVCEAIPSIIYNTRRLEDQLINPAIASITQLQKENSDLKARLGRLEALLTVQ